MMFTRVDRGRIPSQKLEEFTSFIRDEVVPEKFGRRLYDGYAGPKRLWEVREDGHGELMMQPPEFWKEIVGFWSGH